MNVKDLKKLIEILEDSSLESLEYKDETIEVALKKPSAGAIEVVRDTVSTPKDTPVSKTIDAPLVGVFYSKPSPDKEPFVKAGTRFKKGDVLCILEAMKVMNEIKATEDGEIKAVLVQDGDAVGFKTPLFEIV